MEDDLYHSIMTGFGGVTLLPVDLGSVLQIAAVAGLLFVSAMVSGSEVAYFSLTPAECDKLEEAGTTKSKKALELLRNPQKLLATILITNNFVNVGIIMLSAFLSMRLVDFGQHTVVKFVFESVIITALILFFGEILPKIFARSRRMGMALTMSFPLTFLTTFFKPFSSLLLMSTSAVKHRLERHQKNAISKDDLEEALNLTEGQLKDEKDMLDSIVKFSSLTAAEIMTPRLDVVAVDVADPLDDVMNVVIDSGYSRIPVYDERPDNVRGILYVKDLLPHIDKPSEPHFRWQTLPRKPFFIPESKMISDLLQEFQSSKTHMAIVVDEYGGMQGIVTLEDVLEEIVGEISDELDEEEEKNYLRQQDGTIIFEAKISLNDFFKVTDIDEEEFEERRGEAETLAGFLLEINGLIPQRKEVITFGGYTFEIVQADARRIKKVKFSKTSKTSKTA